MLIEGQGVPNVSLFSFGGSASAGLDHFCSTVGRGGTVRVKWPRFVASHVRQSICIQYL